MFRLILACFCFGAASLSAAVWTKIIRENAFAPGDAPYVADNGTLYLHRRGKVAQLSENGEVLREKALPLGANSFFETSNALVAVGGESLVKLSRDDLSVVGRIDFKGYRIMRALPRRAEVVVGLGHGTYPTDLKSWGSKGSAVVFLDDKFHERARHSLGVRTLLTDLALYSNGGALAAYGDYIPADVMGGYLLRHLRRLGADAVEEWSLPVPQEQTEVTVDARDYALSYNGYYARSLGDKRFSRVLVNDSGRPLNHWADEFVDVSGAVGPAWPHPGGGFVLLLPTALMRLRDDSGLDWERAFKGVAKNTSGPLQSGNRIWIVHYFTEPGDQRFVAEAFDLTTGNPLSTKTEWAYRIPEGSWLWNQSPAAAAGKKGELYVTSGIVYQSDPETVPCKGPHGSAKKCRPVHTLVWHID